MQQGSSESDRSGESLGDHIRGLRHSAGLTQQQLADKSGLSVAAIRDLEQGRVARPRRDSSRRLAKALGPAGQQQLLLLPDDNQADRTPPWPGQFRADRATGTGVRIAVLGPLRVLRDGREMPLGRAGQRAVLGLLALSQDAALHRDLIIDALWDGKPPPSAVSILQTHVSRLRSLLAKSARGCSGAPPLLVSEGASYRLQVTADQLDLVEFGHLADRARDAAGSGNPVAACDAYEAALRLWRGEPLADIEVLRAHPAVRFAAQWQVSVVAEFAKTACEVGWYEWPLPALRAAALADPLNEQAYSWLMIALAGLGNQAEALRIYDDLRRRLDEQLGVMPSAVLADAHARVLRQELPEADRVSGRPQDRGPWFAEDEPGAASGRYFRTLTSR